MKTIILLLSFSIQAYSYDIINILLTQNYEQIYKIENPRTAIINSSSILDKIRLSNQQKLALWNAFKQGQPPGELTSEELGNITNFLDSIPEDDLSKLNFSDWRIIKILGQVETFTRAQASVITSALKLKYGLKNLTHASTINKLSSLTCGLSEDDLQKIRNPEFKKINSSVFTKLNSCSGTQLKVLLKKVTQIYGEPRTWSRDVVAHIGMIILALDKEDVRKLRPGAMDGLDVGIILKFRPRMLDDVSPQQREGLNPASKVKIDAFYWKSGASTTIEIKSLMGLFLRTYFLLKYI